MSLVYLPFRLAMTSVEQTKEDFMNFHKGIQGYGREGRRGRKQLEAGRGTMSSSPLFDLGPDTHSPVRNATRLQQRMTRIMDWLISPPSSRYPKVRNQERKKDTNKLLPLLQHTTHPLLYLCSTIPSFHVPLSTKPTQSDLPPLDAAVYFAPLPFSTGACFRQGTFLPEREASDCRPF